MVFVGDVMQSVICKISTTGARGVGYNSVTTIDRFHVQQWINDLISCIVRLTPTHTHTHTHDCELCLASYPGSQPGKRLSYVRIVT